MGQIIDLQITVVIALAHNYYSSLHNFFPLSALAVVTIKACSNYTGMLSDSKIEGAQMQDSTKVLHM